MNSPVAPGPRRATGRLLFALNLIVILALALGIRWAYWADARAYAVGADEPDYVVPAQQFAQEGRYVDTYISRNRIWTRVPLTSIFFAGSFLFVPDPAAVGAEGDDAALMEPRYDALNWAQIAVSLLLIITTMALAWRAFPRRPHGAALVAGYISALYPALASSPAQRALSEPLSMALIFAAILLLTYWSPGASWQRNLAIAAGVGLLLGVGALVRSVAIAFLPFACLYFLWTHHVWRTRPHVGAIDAATPPNSPVATPAGNRGGSSFLARPITSAALAIIMCLLSLAPWVYYNYKQYNSFLLLETANTTAYWHYHNFSREKEDEILRQYDNPSDRLSVIISKGTSNILQYPDQAIGTSIYAFFYAWHLELNSAYLVNSWDFTQRDPDVPDLLHTDAAFLLLSLIGMAGLAGVGLRRPYGVEGRTLLALNLWLVAMLILGIVVPYDSRYRLPAAPALIVLAAGLLLYADWRAVFSPRRAISILRQHWRTAIATLLLSAWVLIGAYSPQIPPMLRSLYQAWRGDIASDPVDAVGRYRLAQQAIPNFYWPYRLEAQALDRVGDPDSARTLYNRVYSMNADDPYAILGFSDLYFRNPQWQLTQDERGWLSRDEAEWRGNPWNSFKPTRTLSVDVGTGSDIPYLLGFHRPDREPTINYRWSRGRAHLRIPLPEGSPSPTSLTLRMSAPGIGPNEPMPVVVTVEGNSTSLDIPAGWTDYSFPIPSPPTPGSTLNVTLQSPTRDLAIFQPDSPDKRKLGVGLDSITLNTSP